MGSIQEPLAVGPVPRPRLAAPPTPSLPVKNTECVLKERRRAC